jgi:hypothetical protein
MIFDFFRITVYLVRKEYFININLIFTFGTKEEKNEIYLII